MRCLTWHHRRLGVVRLLGASRGLSSDSIGLDFQEKCLNICSCLDCLGRPNGLSHMSWNSFSGNNYQGGL